MKKLLILWLALFLVLTGCAGGNSNNNSENSNSGIDVSSSSTEGENPISALPLEETSVSGLSFVGSNTCVSKDGFYYLKSIGDQTLIMHLNEPSMLEIPLCNKPNCKHDDTACNAFVEAVPFLSCIFTAENKLYLCVIERRSSGDDYTEGFVMINEDLSTQVIYSMNLDGTNREKIIELDSSTKLEFPGVISGSLLYAKRTKQSARQAEDNMYTTVSESEELVCIDLSKKTIDLVCDFTGKSIIGLYENKIVVEGRYSDIPSDSVPNPQNETDFLEYYNNQDHSLFTLSLDGKEEKNYITTKIKSFDGVVYGEGLACWMDSSAGQVKKLDLKTGEMSVVPILMVKPTPSLVKILDGKLIYNFDDGQQMNPEITSEYYYDFISGENKEHSLWAQSNTKIPVSVRGELNGRYLVIPKQDEVKENTWAGTVQYNVTKYHYALIGKADYFAAQANYVYFSEG